MMVSKGPIFATADMPLLKRALAVYIQHLITQNKDEYVKETRNVANLQHRISRLDKDNHNVNL